MSAGAKEEAGAEGHPVVAELVEAEVARVLDVREVAALKVLRPLPVHAVRVVDAVVPLMHVTWKKGGEGETKGMRGLT